MALAAADAIDRLLVRLNGEDTEGNRDAGLQRRVGDAAGGLAADVLEVRRVTTDHAGQGDHGVVAILGAMLGGQADLEGTGNRDD